MEINELLIQWKNGVRIMHIAHNLTANYYNKINNIISIFAITLSTIVGTAIFASLRSISNVIIQITLATISVTAAILSAIQLLFKYSELSLQHKNAAIKYGELRRILEQVIVSNTGNNNDFDKFINKFRRKWNSTDQESPTIPQKIHDKVLKEVKSQPKLDLEKINIRGNHNE